MPTRVLIEDDNRPFLEAARVLLKRHGLSVVGAALTSAEALRRAGGELQPDLALVDIMLAEESGFECARDLIEHDRDGGPAVILISTHAEADFADLIAESPARGFLPKSDFSAEAHARRRRQVSSRCPTINVGSQHALSDADVGRRGRCRRRRE
jgi:DNA-binding NarL/FixJ family response regulator